jgi:DNA-binding NarL/FixJ family response regulator
MIHVISADQRFVSQLTRGLERHCPALRILQASDTAGGLRLAHRYAAEIRVVLIDVQLAVVDGRMLAADIRRAVPRAAVIPCARDAGAARFFQALGCEPPIQKSAPAHMIIERIRSALTAAPGALPESLPWAAVRQEQARALTGQAESEPAKPAAERTVAMPRADLEVAVELLRRYRQRAGSRLSRDIHKTLHILENYI